MDKKPKNLKHTSRPARALWIEIIQIAGHYINLTVEAREGLVD